MMRLKKIAIVIGIGGVFLYLFSASVIEDKKTKKRSKAIDIYSQHVADMSSELAHLTALAIVCDQPKRAQKYKSHFINLLRMNVKISAIMHERICYKPIVSKTIKSFCEESKFEYEYYHKALETEFNKNFDLANFSYKNSKYDCENLTRKELSDEDINNDMFEFYEAEKVISTEFKGLNLTNYEMLTLSKGVRAVPCRDRHMIGCLENVSNLFK